jgi:hypothetical protein
MQCSRCNTTIIRGQKMSLMLGQWAHADPALCTDKVAERVPSVTVTVPVSRRLPGFCVDCPAKGLDRTFWSTRFGVWLCLDCVRVRCHKTAS